MKKKQKFNLAIYLYCAWINKTTLSGYVLTVLGIFFVGCSVYVEMSAKTAQCVNFVVLGVLSVGIGCVLLGLTGFGMETYSVYMRLSRITKKGKKNLFSTVSENTHWPMPPCSRIAIQKCNENNPE